MTIGAVAKAHEYACSPRTGQADLVSRRLGLWSPSRSEDDGRLVQAVADARIILRSGEVYKIKQRYGRFSKWILVVLLSYNEMNQIDIFFSYFFSFSSFSYTGKETQTPIRRATPILKHLICILTHCNTTWIYITLYVISKYNRNLKSNGSDIYTYIFGLFYRYHFVEFCHPHWILGPLPSWLGPIWSDRKDTTTVTKVLTLHKLVK